MLKKKNMAMIMAGVTVATSVAPVFAAEENQKAVITTVVNSKDKTATANVVSEVRNLLAVKFDVVRANSDIKVGDCVYTIKIDEKVVTSPIDVEEAIEAGDFTLTIEDKGHEVVDGKVVDSTLEQYETAAEIKKAVEDAEKSLDADKKLGLTATIKENGFDVEVKSTKLNKTTVVKVGDDKLDFTTGKVENKELVFDNEYTDIATVVTHEVEIKSIDEVNAEDLFDGVRLTKEGQELLNKYDVRITTTKTTDEDGKEVEADNLVTDPGFGQGFKAGFEMAITEKSTKDAQEITVQVVSENGRIVKALYDVIKGNSTRVDLVAGEDRFETAIEVSKAGFADDEAKNIVLVGKDAIVDGLASAPLAAKKEAPILLANQDGLTKEVEAEILRVLDNDKLTDATIYIVGGESQISKEAEAQIAKLGVNVVRLSGDDRYETSLAIAEELTKEETTLKPAFVVGGEGEVDAMSIAAKAAQEKAPIVVVNKDEVSEDAKEFMTDREIVVIGGTSSVSEDVVAELDTLDEEEGTVVRLAGEDRQGTNAAVIKKYYSNVGNVFVAKDGYVGGKSQLIDALTAAPLAGNAQAPIVLATNSVSADQEEVLDAKVSAAAKITQIGKGIADSVIANIVKIVKGN